MTPSASTKTPHTRWSPALVVAVGTWLITSLAIIFVAAYALSYLRASAIDKWSFETRNLSVTLAEHTAATMESAYLVLSSVVQEVDHLGVRDAVGLRKMAGTQAAHEMLKNHIRGLPTIDVASIVADNGDVIAFSRSVPAPPVNLADPEYFKAHQETAGMLDYVSAPVRNRGDGRWMFYLSRRLNDRQGNFMGLALVGLSVQAFVDFYNRVNLGPQSAINLYRSDLTQLARWPFNEAVIGKRNLSGSTHEVIMVDRKTEGVRVTDSPRLAEGNRNILRIGAVQTVPKYPFIVNVTITEESFLAGSTRATVFIVSLAALGLIGLAVPFARLIRMIRRHERDVEIARQLGERARAADAAKTNFLATMSHEIRTPMYGILGMLELMERDETDAARRQLFAQVNDSAKTLLSIIDDVLDLSKIEADHLVLRPVQVSLPRLLEQCGNLYREVASRKQITLSVLAGPLVGKAHMADEQRLRQILNNLLSNALKFTDAGVVLLRLESEGVVDGAERLRFSVTDSGIGISQQDLDRLFKPFSQIETGPERRYGGTGLGLSICRRLADAMGGTILVDSAPGRGSTFTLVLRLPTVAREEAPAPAAPAPEPAAAQAAAATAEAGQVRVLVAEDHPVNRMVIKRQLQILGYEADIVEDGKQALDKWLNGRYDIALLDCHMPVMDGLTLSREIRRIEQMRGAGKPTPLVACTANALQDSMRECLAAGMSDHISKPLSLAALKAMMDKWVEKRPPAAAPADIAA